MLRNDSISSKTKFPKRSNILTEHKLIEFETKVLKKKETKVVASSPINTMGHGMAVAGSIAGSISI